MPRFSEDAALPGSLIPVVNSHLGEVCISRYLTGFQSNVDSTLQTIWGDNSLYPYPVSQSVMTISSSSVDDALAGSGLTKVFILGVDDQYVALSEIIELNGQTPVSTVNQYFRILRFTSAGTGVNAGTVYVGTGTVTAGVPANFFALMAPGINNWLHASTTVPTGVVLCITGFIAGGCSKTSGNATCLQLILWERNVNGIERNRAPILLSLANADSATLPLTSFAMRIPEKSDFELRALLDGTGTQDVWSYLTVSLLDNSFSSSLIPEDIQGPGLLALAGALDDDSQF